MGGVFPLICVLQMAGIHLLCLIFYHMEGMSFSCDRVDKFHNIPRPGESKPGAGNGDRVLLQGKGESFQYGPGFGGPGKRLPEEDPALFRVQAVVLHEPDSLLVLLALLPTFLLGAAGVRNPSKTVSTGTAERLSVYRQGRLEVQGHGVLRCLPLLLLRGKLPAFPVAVGPPLVEKGPQVVRLDLHTEVRYQPLPRRRIPLGRARSFRPK